MTHTLDDKIVQAISASTGIGPVAVTEILTAYHEAAAKADATDPDVRPRSVCGCGYELVWMSGQWEHDAAPSLWGDDHDPDEPAPTGPQREHWDRQDGVVDDLGLAAA